MGLDRPFFLFLGDKITNTNRRNDSRHFLILFLYSFGNEIKDTNQSVIVIWGGGGLIFLIRCSLGNENYTYI